jgi:hypothetical protein
MDKTEKAKLRNVAIDLRKILQSARLTDDEVRDMQFCIDEIYRLLQE